MRRGKEKIRNWRWHVIADSEERKSRRSGANKTNESMSIVNGGSVENRGHYLGETSYSHQHYLSWYSSQVLRSPCPLHFPTQSHPPTPHSSSLLNSTAVLPFWETNKRLHSLRLHFFYLLFCHAGPSTPNHNNIIAVSNNQLLKKNSFLGM